MSPPATNGFLAQLSPQSDAVYKLEMLCDLLHVGYTLLMIYRKIYKLNITTITQLNVNDN